MFIFRNYTIENLFDENVWFSGYGDISFIPESDSYVWFYNVPISADNTSIVNEINGITDKLRMVVERIPSSAPFYIVTLENLFPIVINESYYGNNDAICNFNDEARTIADRYSNVKIINFKEFLHCYKPDEWINWKFYFLSQMVISPTIAGTFKIWWSKRISELTSPRKKCIVLDLDNTLWSGVLGEDGISGVKMNGDYPGNAFMYFQEGIIALANSGIIITVCSKNNEADVIELWEKNPFVKLTPKYIAAYRINWQNKADNIRDLAKELNIGLDSMVFVDDNPTERELVRQQLPMVAVPEFPKRPYDLMSFFKEIVNEYFRTYRLTNEDRLKTEQYKANAKRALEQARYTDLTDFIRSLKIHIDIIKANEFNVPRIAQMTQKTNQFNLTTKRYTEGDINAFIANGDDIYCISVKDRFGDSGITGEIIIKRSGDMAEIDTLLLSCRILGKKIESAFVNAILNKLLNEGIKNVRATYIPTTKNSQVSEFYDQLGFTCVENLKGTKTYNLDLSKEIVIPEYYTLNFK